MFEGAEQFHQFLVSSRTTTTTLSMIPLSFPLDHPPNPTFNSNFDPSSLFQSSQHQHNQSNLNLHHHHLLHHHSPPTTSSTKAQLQHQHQHQEEQQTNSASIDPWSANEVLALLRIRSTSIDHNWFPDFTWDHVSRKMGELGYKRSAENCKEKYEEETSINLNGINKLNNKFLISELEEQMFYQEDHNADENEKPMEEEEQVMRAKLQEDPNESDEKNINLAVNPPNPSSDKEEQVVLIAPKPMIKSKKRRSREDKFEMFKGFCVEIVHKMLEKQEELHNKLIQDMAKRDEDKIARDEAWKKQELDRVNKEIEIRAHEQIIAGDRQATMIELLNKFTPQKPYPLGTINFEEFLLSFTQPKTSSVPQTATHALVVQPDEHNIPTTIYAKKVAKVHETRRKPSLTRSTDKPKPDNPLDAGSDDIGRRWPRDEVQALIDMRCSLYNNSNNISNDDNNGKSSGGGGSIWEKISQGMAELGYTRSSKRCKEKWENINKYFRKTKDLNKKRSLDSRTCPYFQQLSSLYNQTAVHDSAVPSDEPAVSHSTSTENPCGLPDSAI